MVESWTSFFDLIHSVIKEVELKVNFNSPVSVLESMSEKIEYCINGVTRVDRVTRDAIHHCAESGLVSDYVYLHTAMERLLLYLHEELKKVQEILTQKLSSSIHAETPFPCGVLAAQSSIVIHSCLPGRPSLSLDIETVVFLRSMHFKWVDIAQLIGVSRSTLYRKCRAFGVYESEKSCLFSYDDLLPVVRNIKEEFPDFGERLLMGMLHARGIRCTRETLRAVIHDTDPINTSLRWNAKIVRRSYCVPGPNSLWHIDGNHKLIRWNIVIHGAIDGYSRLVLFLNSANNNLGTTVLEQFLLATKSYFVPSRIRCDKGTENIEVAKFMLLERGFERGSVITGSSVHNQRIERLWRDLFRGVIFQFYKLFYGLEAIGLLDPLNHIHLYALHLVYIPRINRSLEKFRQGWNHHGISHVNNSSPLQLFILGIAKLQSSGMIAEDFNKIIGDDYGIETDGPVPTYAGEDTVIIPRIEIRLTQHGMDELQQLDVLQDSDDLGIDIFMTALNIVQQYIIV